MTVNRTPAPMGPPYLSRSTGRILIVLLAVTAVCAGAWLARAPLLKGAAQLWIVSEPVVTADAVAIFGGGLEVRPFAAADYYHKRLVKKILLVDVRPGRAETLGILQSHTELNRRVLLSLGVPEKAIESFGRAVSNSREEAIALREWAIRTQARRIIVPTEVFSSRRLRWLLERAFAGTGVHVQVATLDTLDYTPNDWWQHEQGLIAFQNEVIKYFYYRFKY